MPPQTVSSEKIIIIGGGVAGLACGCYLQMNGFNTEILEADSAPGGLCSAWERGDYVFDGCLRWLLGTSPPSAFHRIWRELGVLPGQKTLHPEEIIRIESREHPTLSVPVDLDRLAREFKRIAPEDASRIEALVRAARRCAALEPPLEKPIELLNPLAKLKLGLGYLFMLPIVAKYKHRTVAEYLEAFRNPFLREVLTILSGDTSVSALVTVMVLAWRSRKNAGFIVGGSQAFAQAIADRYSELGGVLRLNTRVTSLKVENRRATGVHCEDGTMIPAATVVSCADGHSTIFKLLGGRFVNQKILDAYEGGERFPALIQASLGINQRFAHAPYALSLPLRHPLVVDDRTQHQRLEVSVLDHDSGLCPKGKTVMTVRFAADCDFWMSLRNSDPDRYQAEKARLLREIIGILEHRFPTLARYVEETDVATPATFVRHTGNWQGSYEGWLPTPRNLSWQLPRTLPGLNHFYMAGQWVGQGGGLPSVALSGRYVAQLICAQRGKSFTTDGG